MTVPPPGFDQAFFDWLDEMSTALSVLFAYPGGVCASDIARLELTICRPLPADVLRFYSRYNPWSALRDYWGAWEITAQTVGEAFGATPPLLPIDSHSYCGLGWDTVLAVHGPEQYEVIERNRATGAVQRHQDLRSYFIASVVREDERGPD